MSEKKEKGGLADIEMVCLACSFFITRIGCWVQSFYEFAND